MEPGREDREHLIAIGSDVNSVSAAMEPGREDREHLLLGWQPGERQRVLQWNPAVKTGSTLSCCWRSLGFQLGCNGTRP